MIERQKDLRVMLAAGLLTLTAVVAKADGNPVVIGNSRFTFVTEQLVRMEHAAHRKFLDDSTLFAVNRRPGDVAVKVEKKDGKYLLSTSAMSVEYEDDGFPFGRRQSACIFLKRRRA